MAHEYPGQVQCIFLRNTSSTDPSDHFPYDTSGFAGLNSQIYMFFKNSDDLTNIDIYRECLNNTIPQNVTFGWQGLPFGLTTSNSNSSSSNSASVNNPSGLRTLLVPVFLLLSSLFLIL